MKKQNYVDDNDWEGRKYANWYTKNFLFLIGGKKQIYFFHYLTHKIYSAFKYFFPYYCIHTTVSNKQITCEKIPKSLGEVLKNLPHQAKNRIWCYRLLLNENRLHTTCGTLKASCMRNLILLSRPLPAACTRQLYIFSFYLGNIGVLCKKKLFPSVPRF